jgi:hypothetical protein
MGVPMRAGTRLAAVLAIALASAALAGSAAAFDFFEGRLNVHGFYETQMRSIARDFESGDDWDLTQWYHILNVEVEGDLAPDGLGPFDVVEAYARLEARYDCVWTRGCGLFSPADAFGDRAARVPKRLGDGHRAGFRSTGVVFNGDTRAFADIPREFLGYRFKERPDGSRRPSEFFTIEGIDTLYDTPGEDQIFGNADDGAPFYFSRQERSCFFNYRRRKGPEDGLGFQIMGPWNPGCDIDPIGALSGKPNPLSPFDRTPLLSAGFGGSVLPLRPVPENLATDPVTGAPRKLENVAEAQGVYLPNERLARRLRGDAFDSFDQNYRQAELEWNRGASQQDEKELREAYLDLEAFDSRLWMRLGKQTIVWGKTELFRNQDQWNPQDLALTSLPSLEESRIGLWAGRFVWHWWDVGPLEDVRTEFVMLYDQFEPADVGRCGEPYAPNPVCNKTFGLFIHGLTGFGVAGEERPPDPWNDAEGIELGGRVEWRWNRFSFALTEYYGFSDVPTQDIVFTYSRNVDPETGRPRVSDSRGRCTTGSEVDCLTPENALARHSVNQQLFHMICATSLGFNTIDPTACGQSVFNSQVTAVPGATVSTILSSVIAGNPFVIPTFRNNFIDNAPFPSVVLNFNACDFQPSTDCADQALFDAPDPAIGVGLVVAPGPDRVFQTLNTTLTDQQEAVLGCGRFYRTNCDLDGVDLMNAEANVITQSFPGFPGTFDRKLRNTTGLVTPGVAQGWRMDDASRPQPGTVGFVGGTVCTRFEKGRSFVLPGCRAPGEVGWDPNVDGDPRAGNAHGPVAGLVFADPTDTVAPFTFTANPVTQDLVQPLSGQRFRTELAALSWNFLMLSVALSPLIDTNGDGEPDGDSIASFNPADPFRIGACSYVQPQFCENVQSIFQVSGLQRNDVRAGGNGRFGRRDWVWQGGKDVALFYEKRNILGFSMDFAEDITKSNWGIETTWVNGEQFANNDVRGGLTRADVYNLTVSVDRPTFINFLNANRTFFINTQVFMQYVNGYRKGFLANGPYNFLGVLTFETGFFDDRLTPRHTLVYDVQSNSGAWLPSIQYRFTANFSATFGLAVFTGREQFRRMSLEPTNLSSRAGQHAYTEVVENGLSAVRDRDEVFLRIRYTF